jgi:hypothetical protein
MNNTQKFNVHTRSFTQRSAATRGFSWGIGAATLMCIFTVLFLTVFSVLSFMTSQNETENSGKFADSVSDYYEANEAAVKFYEYTATLASEKGATEAANEILGTGLDKITVISAAVDSDSGTAVITAKTDITSETGRNVETIFVISADKTVTIVKWKSYSVAEEQWVADDSLDLWIPDF